MKHTPLFSLKSTSGTRKTKSNSFGTCSLRNARKSARLAGGGTPRTANIVSLDADGSTLDSVAEGIEGVAVIITAPVIGVLPPSLGVCPGFGVLSPLFLPSEAMVGNAEDSPSTEKRRGCHFERSTPSSPGGGDACERMMLACTIPSLAGSTSSFGQPPSTGTNCLTSTTLFSWKALMNSAVFSLSLKLMKNTPLLPLKLASGGMKAKSKSLATFSFRNSTSSGRVSVRGTPRTANIVSLDAAGRTLKNVVDDIDGVAVVSGRVGLPNCPGTAKPSIVPASGVMPLPFGVLPPLDFLPCIILSRGMGAPVASKQSGCHSGFSTSFSNTLSQRMLSMFASKPCTRAYDTSHTFLLPKRGNTFLASAL
mmetsp:Transcript_97312/g.271743  ORF Transcript_97312/g.271743 Transcript_97312/m.271743 type:complete len:366 (-) Transcript_97312:511-1608(-)